MPWVALSEARHRVDQMPLDRVFTINSTRVNPKIKLVPYGKTLANLDIVSVAVEVSI